MEVRLAATTPTASDDAVVRILIAIELSKKSWIVGANTRKRALLGSNPPRNSRWKLTAMGRHRQDAGLTVCIGSCAIAEDFPMP